jgi:hypothetical protein
MEYRIETRFQGPGFVAVPNHVAQNVDLPPDALGVLVYLASLPHGWRLDWRDVCARFGIGKDRWQRIARDLRACGAMVDDIEAARGPRGRLSGHRVLVRWPDAKPEAVKGDVSEKPAETGNVTESRKIRLSAAKSDRKPGFPAAGKSAKPSGQIRQTERANPAPYKYQDKKQGGRSASAPVGASADAATAKPYEGQAGASSAQLAQTAKGLNDWQRSSVRNDQPCYVGAAVYRPGSPEFDHLRKLVCRLDAGERVA